MVRTTPGAPVGWGEVVWGWLPWLWTVPCQRTRPVQPADLIISGTPAKTMPLPPSRANFQGGAVGVGTGFCKGTLPSFTDWQTQPRMSDFPTTESWPSNSWPRRGTSSGLQVTGRCDITSDHQALCGAVVLNVSSSLKLH